MSDQNLDLNRNRNTEISIQSEPKPKPKTRAYRIPKTEMLTKTETDKLIFSDHHFNRLHSNCKKKIEIQ